MLHSTYLIIGGGMTADSAISGIRQVDAKSDLFDPGYEAVGELDKFEIVADWKEPFQKGILYYLHLDLVRGILLWNSWGLVDAARKLISEPGPFKPDQLRGRLSETWTL